MRRRIWAGVAGGTVAALLASGCGQDGTTGGGAADRDGDSKVGARAAGGDAAAAAALPAPVAVTSSKVFVLKPGKARWDIGRDPGAVQWSFDPRKDAGWGDLDPGRTWNGANEAKFYTFGGKTYLATVSGRGLAAVVEYSRGKKRFWGTNVLTRPRKPNAYNPHSIELLPTGEVAVASSGSAKKGGVAYANRNVCLFPRGSKKAWSCQKLYDAHGVHWDPARKRLWAIGQLSPRRPHEPRLVAYRIDRAIPGKPKLVEDTALRIKAPYGALHDLMPVPGTDRVWVASGTPVYQVGLGTQKWSKVPGVSKKGTKAVSTHPGSGRVLSNVTYGDRTQRSHTARFHGPYETRTLRYNGKAYPFYKARWATPRQLD
ncbi:hypothetical protein G5C51_00760 [Streptomyces sp. A7024]|uniref:Lipoprotein n=1 Tax=Streptomyces coryli TaxID=1128680 RepID=A0A6G4TRM6_9ACTN|nr:DUF6528 family protein [Streptomyces coryli]NGN62442.1 hypothetical protein [Streptomyces coryli]